MKKYKSLFTESHSQREIIKICQYLINTFKMDFVVIGGAAFSIYTRDKANDLDIIVYDFGTINKEEVDRVIALTNNGELIKAVLFGVEIDFLRPGQEYRDKGKVLFRIPNQVKYNLVQGIKVIDKRELLKLSKDKDREMRSKYL